MSTRLHLPLDTGTDTGTDTGAATGADARNHGAAARGTPGGPVTWLVRTAVPLTTVLLMMASLTWHAAQPLSNGDTWFHLRIGEELAGGWSLQHPGRLSSFGDAPWVPTQWSTELLAARFEAWFGLPGVAWLFGAMYLALLLAVYVVCRREGARMPAAAATVVAVLAAGPALSARPQVVTLVLLAVVVAGWLRAGEGGRPPYLLVPLTWVWATAHGMWSTGVVVSAACCVGLLLDRRRAGTLDRALAVRLLSVPALSVVAACLTPLGPRLLTSQLVVGRRAPLISEWAPTSFRQPQPFLFAVMVGLVVLCWSLRGRVPWLHLLLLLVAAGWALLVSRMVACGAVVVAPLLTGALDQALGPRERLERTAEPCPRWLPRAEGRVLGAGAVLALVALALVVPHTAQRPADVPAAFGPRLATLPAGSPVAVQDGTGAWMEWRYPTLDPVVDGMLDAYPVAYIERFNAFEKLEPGWQSFLRSSRAQVAVLLARSPLTTAVQAELGWRVVQRTGRWAYLVAPSVLPHKDFPKRTNSHISGPTLVEGG